MELIGDEKRIPALFSEARHADDQAAPSFAAVWQRAQSRTYRPRQAFNLAFVAVVALLVCALVSLAWWSRQWQRSPEVIASVPPVTGTVPATPVGNLKGWNQDMNLPRPLPKRVVSSSKSNAKLAVRREAILTAANNKAAQDARTIANWQSPTAALLDSSSDGLLKSLPQMNQTVDEMKSFLPSQPK